MHRLFVAVLAVAPFVAAAQDSSPVPADPPAARPVRDVPAAGAAPSDVYLGVGLGPAVLSPERGGSGGTAFRIRVGTARSPRVAFGFEGGLVVGDYLQLGTYDVGATFAPRQRFYVRGAVGLTTLATRENAAERGANVLLGFGVALGSARGANLTVNVDAQYHRTSAVGGNLARSAAASASAWLGFEWR
jgi:hypothetical protein